MVLFLGLACIFGGFIVITPLLTDKNPALQRFNEKLTPYKIIIGLAILIIGVVKFFVPYHGEGRALIPVFGDFLPAVLAIVVGIFISIEFLESLKKAKEEEVKEEAAGEAVDEAAVETKESFWTRFKSVLQRYQYPIGFASMLFGLLHWFIFRVVFF
jgi:hypothetical protein